VAVLPPPSGFVTSTQPAPAAPVIVTAVTPGASVVQVGATYGYVVKADDTLYSIALLNNTDVETIRRLNNLPDDTIQVGQVLVVPGAGEPTATPGTGDATAVAQATPEAVIHVVGAGENLSSIAAQYNVGWAEIATANNIASPYTIYRGQRLTIPGVAPTPQPTAEVTKHVVAGEDLVGHCPAVQHYRPGHHAGQQSERSQYAGDRPGAGHPPVNGGPARQSTAPVCQTGAVDSVLRADVAA
jgi:LysM repeat protein